MPVSHKKATSKLKIADALKNGRSSIERKMKKERRRCLKAASATASASAVERDPSSLFPLLSLRHNMIMMMMMIISVLGVMIISSAQQPHKLPTPFKS